MDLLHNLNAYIEYKYIIINTNYNKIMYKFTRRDVINNKYLKSENYINKSYMNMR